MAKPFDPEAFEAEITRLQDLPLPELRSAWEQHYGTAAPKTLRRNILVLSIAWRIQADALGGIKPATRKFLREAADAIRAGAPIRPMAKTRIKPGTKLIRDWQGATHTVTALADGFDWQGRPYRSLSQIARAITGSRWNGLVFFGVKRRFPAKPLPPHADAIPREPVNA